MFALIVENNLTGERYPVAEFNAEGDLLIAMKALQAAAPKHLVYKYQAEKPIKWLFEFHGGGWNSVMAKTVEDARTFASQKFGMGIDVNSFRPATPVDENQLMAMFH